MRTKLGFRNRVPLHKGGGGFESWLDVTIHFNTNVTGFSITIDTYLGCVCVSVSRKH